MSNLVSIAKWNLENSLSQMPLLPYKQLLRDLIELQKKNPDFHDVLQAVIDYLKYTHQAYGDYVLGNLKKIDREEKW